MLMGKKQLPSLFAMLICQIIEKKTFPIASRDIQTGFFIFFCSFVIFSNGFYDDAKCNWRWDDYMESSKFFFSEGWQRGIELFEIYGYGKKGGAGFCYLK